MTRRDGPSLTPHRVSRYTPRKRLWDQLGSVRRAPLGVFQTRDQTRAFYNKISGVYDLLADRSEAPVRRAGLDLLKVRAGEKVLEIGFGTGHSLVRLATAVGPHGQVLGLDLSDKMLVVARANLAKAGLSARVRLRRGDAADLPYADGSLDAVFMSFTLELFDTPEIPEVLSECRRVLRPGGRIVVIGMSTDYATGVPQSRRSQRGRRRRRRSARPSTSPGSRRRSPRPWSRGGSPNVHSLPRSRRPRVRETRSGCLVACASW
jgi:ubiquinone/menaquinone biosynthesis C-methylase UbiE